MGHVLKIDKDDPDPLSTIQLALTANGDLTVVIPKGSRLSINDRRELRENILADKARVRELTLVFEDQESLLTRLSNWFKDLLR